MDTQVKQLNDNETSIDQTLIEMLESRLRGDLLLPSHCEYEQARQIWNGMIDRHPAMIVRCMGTADVITTVKFASDHQLLLSVKSGGHNIAGSAVCEGGLMIDLSTMTGVTVDPVNKTAQVQCGALLGDVDHECQIFGLAVPTGINSTTGIAGLALGGGYGWLSRLLGHTVDNIISVDIVTAEGKFLHLSDNENTDLFWAIRGGSGNFGVVTKFEFALHNVGPTILSGPVVFPLEQARDVLKKYRLIAKNLPDEASCWTVMRKAPPFPFLDPKYHGQPVLVLAMAYVGDIRKGEQVLAPLRELGQSIGDAVGPCPYKNWQSAFDPLLTPGSRNYWKSSDFTEISDAVIDILLDAVTKLPSDECEIFTAQLGGAASRVPSNAMAYPHRSTLYTMNIHGRWQNKTDDESSIAWVRTLFNSVEEHSTGSVYVNFVPEQDEIRKVGPYGANKAKLEHIKMKYDPKNLFRSNINILPK
ncbi:FAD-binding oxidoreductase [Colwellia hornerae]|uniref:FAD-binding oxidoreductase n=1 Tax=Colwellia hornerae TaxID=89402 RepID=A0A5C6Q2Z4_9GAMM|nr:FAD-binding oxidoreductase [Colwellia hornerae]TWX47162.1 FAD-binding oxidoreductase [Colwellia hornerae]TWX54339.1 FAD-binding oxidoreductase [Colwellia hornerae]TWX63229.1 FAD-binding oxidoreductase [Colwellia hornerae]